MSLKNRLPCLQWPRLSLSLLRGETLAGLSVGLMVIPQGVAYAALAGMPLITGIYAALLPALVAALFGGSPRLSVGPTALTCLLVTASLAGMAPPGSADWVTLAVWLALLSGLLQVVLGLARFGWVLNLVNAPVLSAFTQAAAVLIIASQVRELLGWRNGDDGPALHPASLAFGLGTLALLWFTRRWTSKLPLLLLAVVVASAGLSLWTGFADGGGTVVGALPSGWPALYIPHWLPLDTLGHLVVPALVITLVSYLETAASARIDHSREGRLWDRDQDLIAQGLAKLASALSGAFPTSSSFSRSALNLYAGARSGWATLASVAVVGLALLWFLPVLHHVPKAVLAAIVVVAVIGLIRPREFWRLWQVSRVEAVIAGSTFLITLLTAPRLYWGVIAGVLMALSHFLFGRLHPRIVEVGRHPDGRLRDRHLWQLPVLAPDTFALRMDAELDFASASALERAITTHLNSHPGTQRVVLLAQPINRIDATGVETFGRLRQQLAGRRVVLYVVGLKLPVELALRAAGELTEAPYLKVLVTEAELMRVLADMATAEDTAPNPTDHAGHDDGASTPKEAPATS